MIAVRPAHAKAPTRVERLPNELPTLKKWRDRLAGMSQLPTPPLLAALLERSSNRRISAGSTVDAALGPRRTTHLPCDVCKLSPLTPAQSYQRHSSRAKAFTICSGAAATSHSAFGKCSDSSCTVCHLDWMPRPAPVSQGEDDCQCRIHTVNATVQCVEDLPERTHADLGMTRSRRASRSSLATHPINSSSHCSAPAGRSCAM